MSEQTTPEENGPAHEALTESPEVATTPDDDAAIATGTGPWWRKVPLWLWIAAAVVILGGGAVGVLATSGTFDPAPLPTPPAETVTAPAPTPTAEPVERPFEPTAFSAVLPDSVLDLALAEIAADAGRWTETDPLEAYALTYSDGGAKEVTLEAAQYADEETATGALPDVMVDDVETGEVRAGGVVVGEYWIVPADGTASIVWRNSTAVFVLEGPEEVVRDVFRAFPL